MLRLSLRALLLITVLSAAMFTVRLIGKAQPAPSLLSVIFTNPDGSPCEMPCMFGVRPGKMTAEEAAKILRQHPYTQTMKESLGSDSVDTIFQAQGVIVYVGAGADWMGMFFGDVDSQLPLARKALLNGRSLGNVIRIWGHPDLVEVMDDNCPWSIYPSTTLFYTAKSVELTYRRLFADYLLPTDALTTVIVNPGRQAFSPCSQCWRGFGHIRRYSSPGCP
ncbi:MAG: hypothetical protein IT324_14335 [Anaerolineae bacterium]|nr:hypothetical protein [Anaerolineae bacterium]